VASGLHIARQLHSPLQTSFPELSGISSLHVHVVPSFAQYPRHEPLASSNSHPIHLQSVQTFFPVLSTVQSNAPHVWSAGHVPVHPPDAVSEPQGWVEVVIAVTAGRMPGTAVWETTTGPASPALQWHSAYSVFPVSGSFDMVLIWQF
jgi:hypothetical protein